MNMECHTDIQIFLHLKDFVDKMYFDIWVFATIPQVHNTDRDWLVYVRVIGIWDALD